MSNWTFLMLEKIISLEIGLCPFLYVMGPLPLRTVCRLVPADTVAENYIGFGLAPCEKASI